MAYNQVIVQFLHQLKKIPWASLSDQFLTLGFTDSPFYHTLKLISLNDEFFTLGPRRTFSWCNPTRINCIGGVMVSVLASSAIIDRVFEPRSGQTKDYKIGICCFSANHTTLRRQNKDWMGRNQDNVSEWGDMSTC